MAVVARADNPDIPGIKKMSHKHEEILNVLLSNPLMKLGHVAQVMNVTPAWLSLVIHSDAFQKRLRERQDIRFHESIMPLMDKVTDLTHRALERAMELVDYETDLSKLNAVMNKGLDRLGYGSLPAAPPGTTISVHLEQQRLARARDLIGKARGSLLYGEDGEVIESGSDPVGQSDQATSIHITVRTHETAEDGGEV